MATAMPASPTDGADGGATEIVARAPHASGPPTAQELAELRRDARATVTALLREHGDDLYRYCRNFVGTEADAVHVVETVLMEVYQDLHRFQGRCSVRTWLFAIARHRSLDFVGAIRRGKIHIDPETLAGYRDERASIDVVLADRAERKGLGECLDRLEGPVRALVVLRFIDQLAYHDMERLTGQSAATLRIRVSRALKTLHECLQKKMSPIVR